MTMTPVHSRSVLAMGHDAETNTLTVQFANGATYAYDGVTAEDHQRLLQAESVGRYFATHIRGRFPHTKLASTPVITKGTPV